MYNISCNTKKFFIILLRTNASPYPYMAMYIYIESKKLLLTF